MPYTPNTAWVDGSGGGTPLTAARLNNLEAGLSYELAYTQFTAPVSITATTEATATTIVTASAVTFNGSTVAVIEFCCPYVDVPANAAGNTCSICLYDGAASIGILSVPGSASNVGVFVPGSGQRVLTPSAAAHTYSIRAFRSNANCTIGVGAGGLGAYMPGFIRIRKVV